MKSLFRIDSISFFSEILPFAQHYNFVSYLIAIKNDKKLGVSINLSFQNKDLLYEGRALSWSNCAAVRKLSSRKN